MYYGRCIASADVIRGTTKKTSKTGGGGIFFFFFFLAVLHI